MNRTIAKDMMESVRSNTSIEILHSDIGLFDMNLHQFVRDYDASKKIAHHEDHTRDGKSYAVTCEVCEKIVGHLRNKGTMCSYGACHGVGNVKPCKSCNKTVCGKHTYDYPSSRYHGGDFLTSGIDTVHYRVCQDCFFNIPTDTFNPIVCRKCNDTVCEFHSVAYVYNKYVYEEKPKNCFLID